MDSTFSKLQPDSGTGAQSTFDLDEMVNQVRRSLHAELDPLVIRHTLIEVLSNYKDARVQTFIPILACRGALEILITKDDKN
jgi:hypothetical protein